MNTAEEDQTLLKKIIQVVVQNDERKKILIMEISVSSWKSCQPVCTFFFTIVLTLQEYEHIKMTI